jgi:hypothetical protein
MRTRDPMERILLQCLDPSVLFFLCFSASFLTLYKLRQESQKPLHVDVPSTVKRCEEDGGQAACHFVISRQPLVYVMSRTSLGDAWWLGQAVSLEPCSVCVLLYKKSRTTTDGAWPKGKEARGQTRGADGWKSRRFGREKDRGIGEACIMHACMPALHLHHASLHNDSLSAWRSIKMSLHFLQLPRQ